MPLSTDTQVLETSNGLVSTLRGMAGDAGQSFRPGLSFPPPPLHNPSKSLTLTPKFSPCKRSSPHRNIHTHLLRCRADFSPAFQRCIHTNHRPLLLLNWLPQNPRHRRQCQSARNRNPIPPPGAKRQTAAHRHNRPFHEILSHTYWRRVPRIPKSSNKQQCRRSRPRVSVSPPRNCAVPTGP